MFIIYFYSPIASYLIWLHGMIDVEHDSKPMYTVLASLEKNMEIF